jgi:diguanylate cyclase (GGDEF)-like protein
VRSGRGFCLALVDIDHFKRINDLHGHAVGDEALRRFSREAQSALRVSDVMARWGGEEFVLLLPDTRAPLAKAGLERLRERIAAMALPPVDDDRLTLTLSAGVTEHIAGESTAQALERADRALYEAKAQGRNRVVVG